MLFISFWGQQVRFRAVQIKHDSTWGLLENQYSPSGRLVDWLVNICFCSSRFLLVRQMLLNLLALFPHQPLDWCVINQIRLLAEHWAPEEKWQQKENVSNVSSDNVQKYQVWIFVQLPFKTWSRAQELVCGRDIITYWKYSVWWGEVRQQHH